MITLAIDTSEARGSVALRVERRLVSSRSHADSMDYSAWLLPNVDGVLREAGVRQADVTLLAVATGPGSFTGLRVGLTTVKAWAEVFGTKTVGVSRLEAMSRLAQACGAPYVAACYDAQRGQLFGALYERGSDDFRLVQNEMVIEAGAFLAFVAAQTNGDKVDWVSMDPALLASAAGWDERARLGETILQSRADLADTIGAIGEERAARGMFTDPLELDANYVRRSDAEIFWKDPVRPAHA